MIEISGDDCFRVLDSKKLIFFYFTASWCGPCQNILPKIKELSEKLNEKIDFYKIDISNDNNTDICEKCQVESVPKFVLFKERNSLGIVNGGNIEQIINLLKNNF
jgi:thiol-disulfide isomerase/thioredoxin